MAQVNGGSQAVAEALATVQSLRPESRTEFDELVAKMQEQAAEIVRLRAREAQHSRAAVSGVRIGMPKDPGKGTLCIYGLGRYPVALYGSQALRLAAALGCPPESPLPAFVRANAAALSWREDDGKGFAESWEAYENGRVK